MAGVLRRVALFYAIAFGLAWGIEGVIFIAGGFTTAALILLYGLGWVSPSIAAAVLVRLEGGSVKAHFARLLSWKLSPLYLVALLLPSAALFIANPVIYVQTGPGLIGPPLVEEPGWRGYAYDRLRRVWPALATALLTGFLWALWHVPTWFLPGVHADVSLLPAYVLWLIGAGLLAGWFYERLGLTGSLVLHAGLNLNLVAILGSRFLLAAGILTAFACAIHLFGGARVEQRQARAPARR